MKPAIADLVEEIEHFRNHLGMYLFPQDVANVRSFLSGLNMGLYCAGISIGKNVRREVQLARGWMENPCGIEPQMEERGMNVPKIIDELIDIEIEVLRRSIL